MVHLLLAPIGTSIILSIKFLNPSFLSHIRAEKYPETSNSALLRWQVLKKLRLALESESNTTYFLTETYTSTFLECDCALQFRNDETEDTE